MKQNSIFSTSTFPLTAFLVGFFLLLNTACYQIPENVMPSEVPFMLGNYLITEYNGHTINHYTMGIHYHPGADANRIEFCNFANRKINVIATLNDDFTLSIPQQQFVSDFSSFQIFQGTGTINQKGFYLEYWAGDEKKTFTYKVRATPGL